MATVHPRAKDVGTMNGAMCKLVAVFHLHSWYRSSVC